MKIVGLDYFGLDVNNEVVVKITNFLGNNHFGDIYNFICIYIQFYFYLCLVCRKKKLYGYALVGSLLNFIPQCLLFVFYKLDWVYVLICFSITIIFPMIINRKIGIKEQIKYILLINLYQLISLTIRNVGVNNNYGNFLIDSLLNIDQLLMLAITYNLFFMKGGLKLCGVEQVVGSSLPKKMNLSKLLKSSQKSLDKFKKLKREEKATLIIYYILSSIWNIFTLAMIVLIAMLNNTLVECIYIATSFWLTKGIFGKPFHLKSMLKCFALSNITYYILNRITTPLGISMIVPIMLGVGLSYVTSKLVKKANKLYKGMPEDLFNQLVLKIVDKRSLKYEICYDFYVNRKSAINLALKYNYSEPGIRKITERMNKRVREL